ncbi:substrate-binding domain-containing protein [Arthrobacter sp. ok362]|uniref:substrate-binding domain-containing protein n=1 Tax=Arthrobacter sp. ok362 TaxID=1761745 RepID=UPI0020C8BDD7|nr:substrate-binding domain-containing protein [Arthrobacter sp. ok362]
MTEAGCTPVTATGSFFYESGAAGADELRQQEPGLTAIFAMSDEMGAAVVNELQRRRLRVPEDVSVLGFDNTSTSLHVNPPLSTMAQPLEDMGRMAVKKLLRSRDLGPKIMPHRRGMGVCRRRPLRRERLTPEGRQSQWGASEFKQRATARLIQVLRDPWENRYRSPTITPSSSPGLTPPPRISVTGVSH